MITLPPEFAATKYPGYFWNCETQKLFSIKVDGILKELKFVRPNRWNFMPIPGYVVSVKGRRKWLLITELKKLTPKDGVIPVKTLKDQLKSYIM